MRAFHTTIIFLLLLAAHILVMTSPVCASHDQGLGKSQDGSDTVSVAIAPEPLSGLLFLGGLGLMVWRLRRENSSK